MTAVGALVLTTALPDQQPGLGSARLAVLAGGLADTRRTHLLTGRYTASPASVSVAQPRTFGATARAAF